MAETVEASESLPRNKTPGTESVARAADVLLQFINSSTLGVSSIARELGLPKAVVYRILQSLASRNLVVPDARRQYRLGSAAMALGARALQESDLRAAALPVLRRLRDETEETSTLSELMGNRRAYIDQCVSPQELKMTVEVGRTFPLHAGASSKAILAFLPEERRERILNASLEALTDRTTCDPDALRVELAEIAAAGVVVTRGERQRGSMSVAAPVFAPDGEVQAAISVSGPADRFDDETCTRYRQLVRDASVEISQVWARGETRR